MFFDSIMQEIQWIHVVVSSILLINKVWSPLAYNIYTIQNTSPARFGLVHRVYIIMESCSHQYRCQGTTSLGLLHACDPIIYHISSYHYIGNVSIIYYQHITAGCILSLISFTNCSTNFVHQINSSNSWRLGISRNYNPWRLYTIIPSSIKCVAYSDACHEGTPACSGKYTVESV